MKRNTSHSDSNQVIRIRPFQYIHILDTNTNTVRVITGPLKYTCKEHEVIATGPEAMIIIPPRHYIVIDNPVIFTKVLNNTNKMENVPLDQNGQVLLKYGDQEIRFEQEPFPLYPGEQMNGSMSKLQIVEDNMALRLRAVRDIVDNFAKGSIVGIERRCGEEWLFYGPGTYIPQIGVEVVETIKSEIIKPNQALHVRARSDCLDYENNERNAGEEWLVTKLGPYLRQVHEEKMGFVKPIVLTYDKAIHVTALQTFYDIDGEKRTAGSSWLVSRENHEIYIPGPYERVDSVVNLTVLRENNWCIILNSWDNNDKKTVFGKKEIIMGPKHFFLKPGESIEDSSILDKIILQSNECLMLEAREKDVVDEKKKRKPGERWIIYGPRIYVPSLGVRVLRKKNAFFYVEPLGIYVFEPIQLFVKITLIYLILYVLTRLLF